MATILFMYVVCALYCDTENSEECDSQLELSMDTGILRASSISTSSHYGVASMEYDKCRSLQRDASNVSSISTSSHNGVTSKEWCSISSSMSCETDLLDFQDKQQPQHLIDSH